MADVEFAGAKLTGRPLMEEEQRLLEHHVFDFLAVGNDFLGALFKEHHKAIIGAAQVAKERLDAVFGGILAPDSEIGVSLIRPGHILRNTSTTESPINTWDTEGIQAGALVSGTDNWIGYSTNNATAVNIDKDGLVLAMGIGFTQGHKPAVEALQYIVGQITFPQISARHTQFADNPGRLRAIRHPAILMPPKETVRAITYSEEGFRQELVLLGLTFGLGRYLRTQAYTSVST